MTLKNDELNTPRVSVEDPEKYFSKMDITKKQKEARVRVTDELLDVLLFLFALLQVEREMPSPDYEAVYLEFWTEWVSVVWQNVRMDGYTEEYVEDKARKIFDDTLRNLQGIEGGDDAGWWFSPDRATSIAENEANSILNYEELQDAIDAGYTHKTWVAEIDNRTRRDHRNMNGTRIPITEYFIFPDCVMMMPHDTVNGTEDQTANCRCSLEYSKDGAYEAEESRRRTKGREESTKADRSLMDDAVLKHRLSVLGEDDVVIGTMVSRIKEMIGHRSGTHFEDLAYIDTANNKSQINKSYDYYDGEASRCEPSAPMNRMLSRAEEYSIVGIHNHPESKAPSLSDIFVAYHRKYKYGIVVAHNGVIYKYRVTANPDGPWMYSIEKKLDRLNDALYDGNELEKVTDDLAGYGVFMEVLP